MIYPSIVFTKAFSKMRALVKAVSKSFSLSLFSSFQNHLVSYHAVMLNCPCLHLKTSFKLCSKNTFFHENLHFLLLAKGNHASSLSNLVVISCPSFPENPQVIEEQTVSCCECWQMLMLTPCCRSSQLFEIQNMLEKTLHCAVSVADRHIQMIQTPPSIFQNDHAAAPAPSASTSSPLPAGASLQTQRAFHQCSAEFVEPSLPR